MVNTLRTHSAQYAAVVSVESVIHAGPYDLPSLARGNPGALEALRRVYALALQRIYIVALSAGCAAAVCTFGMELKNVKQVQNARRGERESPRMRGGSDGDVKVEDLREAP